jgi:hypothetical protein
MPAVSADYLDDEALLYDPTTTRATRLNASAALVWDLCDGTRSVREIAAILDAQFPGSTAAQEVPSLLGDFARAGLIAFR